jgi:putative tryptophan/tyrosine transport system substrate-binding protein
LTIVPELATGVSQHGAREHIRQHSALAVDCLGPIDNVEEVTRHAELIAENVEALVLVDDGMLIANAKEIGGMSSAQRLASIGFTEFARGGGLLGYGVNFPAMFSRAAILVDRLLKGAKPGDLPIEQATTFEMVANLRTARALSLEIPPTLLARADEVIE